MCGCTTLFRVVGRGTQKEIKGIPEGFDYLLVLGEIFSVLRVRKRARWAKNAIIFVVYENFGMDEAALPHFWGIKHGGH